ncbi:hypothetical protein ANCCAN_29457 [Ancylostoma caninum]|uniref:Uncharacterized protein n=1 Tax=Ancylostoma caninum TaxID=29170 RepID=A0A368F1C7_ANCCA|nr:hypothetical protein ANCCAN_29457 [Ancylostoma caninum]
MRSLMTRNMSLSLISSVRTPSGTSTRCQWRRGFSKIFSYLWIIRSQAMICSIDLIRLPSMSIYVHLWMVSL